MKNLELLAPAKNKEIGIAAIDCGADAVYIAGPGFGARKAAGNSIADIRELCSYAHRFGARIYLTVNTIIYDNELDEVHRMMLDAQEAGVDAFIVQDLALTCWEDITIPLHASTQCAIRDAGKARFLESLGFARLVLEREMTLDRIREIGGSCACELEFFVHGALCVCYSGNCYLSEKIAGRSANRGECIQACRSMYDLVDGSGKVLVRNKALLSLKDYKLLDRLSDLASAGVCSFKIEGRLKNESYVRNVVRQYSMALDELVAAHPEEYCRASFGVVGRSFVPDVDKTFNRGYTELFIDGKRGRWSSMDTPKSVGEKIGRIGDIRRLDKFTVEITVIPDHKGLVLGNGDGFSVATQNGLTGFRGDVCKGLVIRCKDVAGLRRGAEIFRNLAAGFEHEIESNACKRELRAGITMKIHGKYNLDFTVRSEDGREILSTFKTDLETAENKERALAMMSEQLSKRAEGFIFHLDDVVVETPGGALPLMSASTLNSIRRLLASDLDAQPCGRRPIAEGKRSETVKLEAVLDYKANVANGMARRRLESAGADVAGSAYELEHQPDAELMRTKYCIRHELGMCLKDGGKAGKLFLLNNGRRFALEFDCKACEMVVREG